ncbi:MAG: hypothetical protein OXG38_02450 [Chloroflexi bacterium]|nr:hypothetical protein [Chloroflexota bacterium]
MGDLLDEIVVVGGLALYLLVDPDALPTGSGSHAGTMDLDVGLALDILDKDRYRDLGARLRDAGFKAAVNDEGNLTLQTWTAPTRPPVRVDFLIPPADDTTRGGTVLHIEPDFAAIVTPGLDLPFRDRRRKELSGRIPSGALAFRNIPVCGPGAFTVLKALAFGNRTENKDAYDLFYVWRGVGLDDVVASLTSIERSPYIDDALSVIERDFCHHDGPGPVATASFIARGLDDDIQADVVGYAQELLRSMRRR